MHRLREGPPADSNQGGHCSLWVRGRRDVLADEHRIGPEGPVGHDILWAADTALGDEDRVLGQVGVSPDPCDVVAVHLEGDQVTGVDAEALLDRYSAQLGIYREALSQALGMPVKETLLYSFFMNSTVKVGTV